MVGRLNLPRKFITPEQARIYTAGRYQSCSLHGRNSPQALRLTVCGIRRSTMKPLAIHDLRSALRLFRARPAFAVSAALTVATASGFLGVATNLAAALLAPYISGGNAFSPAVSVIGEAIVQTGIGDEEPLAAIRPVALVLLAAGGMVVIAACANLATLSMSHYRTRLGEFAIRASVGGTPRRLLRQL